MSEQDSICAPEEKLPVEYREIEGWTGYRVGSDGSVWTKRLSGGRFRREWHRMIGGVDRRGYNKVTLCNNGVQTCQRICRLVLKAFRGPCPDGMESCHGPKGNAVDSLDNLRWDTHVSNMADKIEQGTAQRGENHALAKLTADDVLEIRRRWAAGGITQRDIGRQYGVKNVTICAIVTGRNWKHLQANTAKSEVLITRNGRE